MKVSIVSNHKLVLAKQSDIVNVPKVVFVTGENARIPANGAPNVLDFVNGRLEQGKGFRKSKIRGEKTSSVEKKGGPDEGGLDVD